MHIINYQIQQVAGQLGNTHRLRNRYTILGRGGQCQLSTLEYDESLLPEIKRTQPKANQQKEQKLPQQIIKELEGVIRKRRRYRDQQPMKVPVRSSKGGDQLTSWSLEGEKTTIWSQPRQKTKKRMPSAKKDKDNEAKYLSLDLYSRMINSFKQSYHLGSITFNKANEKRTVRHSIDHFRQTMLQKDLSSELISRRRLTLLRQKSKLTGIQPPPQVQLPPPIERKQSNHGRSAPLEQIQQQPSITTIKSRMDEPIQKVTRPPEQTQTHLKCSNKDYERPWRTNFHFPELTVLGNLPAPKRDFTPWRKVEQTEQDLPVT